jgi:4-hydroxy-3-methylbut-2-enyl diphosphate reductase
VRSLVQELQQRRPESEVRFVDTVCRPTKDRQAALRKLIEQVELVVVVGGRGSNNTRQLVEACRSAGRRVIHLERAEEVQADAFDQVETVGLTAGTSTLPETVAAVHARLLEIAND